MDNVSCSLLLNILLYHSYVCSSTQSLLVALLVIPVVLRAHFGLLGLLDYPEAEKITQLTDSHDDAKQGDK